MHILSLLICLEKIESRVKMNKEIERKYDVKYLPNEKEAKQFDKPDWLGEEIGYKELSNRKLPK